MSNRIETEKKTVELMVRMYCKDIHQRAELCKDCEELITYSKNRLEHCQFGIDKPVCNNCTIHCYKPDYRQRIREIMRYSGPRMLLRHPYLAIKHLIRSKL